MAEHDKNALTIEAVGLRKVFRDFWGRPKAAAVNGIDFSVRQGEVLGFLGPNGSGKSTTVKMLMGLLYPTSGSLRVFGRSATHVHTKMRIGYLPEETYLYKYLTAAETLDFFGSLFQLPADVRRSRARQLLDQVGLSKSAQRPVGEFSKGMARRIGLAQALINDPDLVILDEPTSGLDPIGCREVKDIIKLLAQRHKTVILCSHLLADVEDVCDSVMIMYGGKIRARGNLRELLTEGDKTRIVTPALTPEMVARIMTVLNESLPPGSCQVDAPTMSLEDFFLDVVRQARSESVATAGAEAEGKIAAFLRGEAEPKSGEALLAALSAPEAAPAPAVPAPAPPPRVDEKRLEALSQEEEPKAAPPPAPVREQTPEEKAAAAKRIQDILKRE